MSEPTRRPPRTYDGERITVTFDASRCLHAAECVRGAPAVFDTGRRPWVDADAAEPDLIAEVVRRCPSGALHYDRRDGTTEPPDRPTRVTASPGGPLWLRGDLLLETDAGEHRDTRAALCPCGATANAPFCDASGDCRGQHPS